MCNYNENQQTFSKPHGPGPVRERAGAILGHEKIVYSPCNRNSKEARTCDYPYDQHRLCRKSQKVLQETKMKETVF
jgi:hypothetical protein